MSSKPFGYAAFVILLAAMPCIAQQRDSTKVYPGVTGVVTDVMEQQMGMMGKMMTLMLESAFTVLAQPETADRAAMFTKNYFDALMKKGFTRDEAFRLVLAHGIPIPAAK
ncbi:MAG TPA: hypothetical protein VKH19_05360 [Gemmatimonadaceae bacterium]|nr:hypothetical protein [Gemmatimonadaceae bacterium]